MPSDSQAYLAVRCGDTKRLRPFMMGETFNFPACANNVQMDAYARLASQWLPLDQVAEEGQVHDVNMTTVNGSILSAKVKVSAAADVVADKKSAAQSRHRFALEAKSYMDVHDVWSVVQGMLNEILKEQPADPLVFMLKHLEGQLQARQLAQAKANDMEQFNSVNGSTQEMPNLSEHHSMAAIVLREQPAIWEALIHSQTDAGVPFLACVQPGLVFAGHPRVPAVGAVAGDAACYSKFQQLFDPLLQKLTGLELVAASHPMEAVAASVSSRVVDVSGRYALSARVRSRRCLQGMRFPTACDTEERREAERVLSKVLARLEDDDLYGEYFPLSGSTSFAPKPVGMTADEEEELKKSHFLFSQPTGKAQVASGLARDWPDARGVFAAESRKFAAWCNEEDHLQLVALELGPDLRGAFERLVRASKQVEESLQSCGYEFARDDRLGYLTASPANVGSGLRASLMLNLPRLLAHAGPALPDLGRKLQLQILSLGGGSSLGTGLCEVTNQLRLGSTEVAQVNLVIEGAASLVELEQLLEMGTAFEDACSRILEQR